MATLPPTARETRKRRRNPLSRLRRSTRGWLLRRPPPQAGVDFVGGAPAPALLAGLGLRRVHVLRRGESLRPWRLLALVRALRRERYDAAIHLGTATGSLGAFLVG